MIPGRGLAAGLIVGCALAPAWSAEPFAVDVLPLRAVLHEDVRVLWLGDSYSTPYASRPSAASLLSWRLDRWTAFTMGDGPNWFFPKYDEQIAGFNVIDASNGYRIFQTGPDPVVRYALPVWRLRELYLDAPSPEPIDVMRYRMTRQDISVGFHGAFFEAGETLHVRQLFLEPPGIPPMLPGLTITPQIGTPAWFDPRAETRPKRLDGLDPESDAPTPPADGQISAAPVDVEMTANASGNLFYTLAVDAPGEGEAGYVLPAGYVAYRTEDGERLPGMYFSVLADSSWEYEGFGLDTPSGTPGAITKTFSRAQLAHWLDATTIDPARPIFAFYLVNAEDIEPGVAASQMEAMINQTAGAAADAGLGPVHHCIVIPWMHRINGQDIFGRHEEQRDVAFALAASRPDVSAISIYDFTDGMMFDGSAESRQWLADNGFDAFTYGSITIDLSTESTGPNGGLLDIYRSHPATRDSGAFFAHVIERAFFDACPADFAPPYGLLDLADIQGFLTRFMAQAPSADLAPPVGVFDLADLTAFVTSFFGGCPSD